MPDNKVVIIVGVSPSDDPNDPLAGVELAGRNLELDEHGVVKERPPGTPVEFWVCPRLNEPWTWHVLPNQHHDGDCCDCHVALVYRISEISPKNAAIKICRRCMSKRLLEERRG